MRIRFLCVFFFFFKQKTAYEIMPSLVGSEMCIRDRYQRRVHGMSKRKLLGLVKEGYVNGWDDPRMPTICGLRRRGFTPESIRNFAETIGVAKRDNVIDVSLLEFCLREDLNKRARRALAVLNPVKLIIDNYPEGQTEELDAVNNPENPDEGLRKVPFSKELYIEREDFMEEPPSKYFRLAPGREVRLKYAYIIKCESVVKDPETGNITEIHCTYAVSYTHLTLPTICSVQISVVAVSLKKKKKKIMWRE
eukprot:TRINITY_DN12341_c0_g1_i1.p1 TRINITY_DN12341_c0_g1~~TRINITY_DN12341_c0_g1_i1.p1  ORF type:complete len:250 (+),score=26.61 TRINITY_DN12341_c0_g1_i1:39-788(+)